MAISKRERGGGAVLSNLRRAHASDHVLVEGRRILAVIQDFFAEDFRPHLLDRLLREEREGLGHGIGRNPVAFEPDVLHGVDFAGVLEVHVLARIERLLVLDMAALDQPLGQRVGRASGGLGYWTDHLWRGRGDRRLDCCRRHAVLE